MASEVEESPFDVVYEKYELINKTFTKARSYLISQLKKCFLTDLDDLNFTELIESVGEIESVEYYNSNNIKPLNPPTIDTTNLTTYNETLYFRIRYYMRLLAYYLALKGVPTDKIADQHDLIGLISLIELINVKLPTIMTVQEITEEYYFGLNISLDYILKDIYGGDVKDGEIIIESENIVYDSIDAAQPISFTPLKISEKNNGIYQPITFTFTYMGSDKYRSYPPINREIIIKPAKIVLDVFISNINAQSRYYGDSTTGYIDDVWSINVRTYNYKGEVLPNIPFLLSIEDGEAITIDYDNSYANLSLLNSTTDISGVTDENGNCVINCVINQIGQQSINIQTTYENTDLMTNTEKEHNLTTYYNPLCQNQKDYIDYLGKASYDYELILRNKNTGELYDNSFDNQKVSIYLNNQFLKYITINNGRALLSLSSEIELANLTAGDHTILWEFNNDKRKTALTLFSNFILPKQDKFFLTDTPDIYYTPLYTETYDTEDWSPIIRKKAVVGLFYYDEDGELEEHIDSPLELYTDSNGILHGLKTYIEPHRYALSLTTGSDNLNETLYPYFYEIAKPFQIYFDEDNSNKKEKAVFNIKIYDKEHYQIGQHTNYISFNKDFTGLYSITENEYDEYYDINLTIPAREETIGTNILTVTVNEYSENTNFKLSDKIFELLTNTTNIGEQQIQIKCYDDSIEDISIESEYIDMNSYEKDNGIFTIDATFIKAGYINFEINSEEDSESFVIIVNKGNLEPSIIIEKYTPYTEEVIDADTQQTVILHKNYVEEVNECQYDEIDNIHIQLLIEDLYDDIDITYEFNEYSETYTYNGQDKYFTIPDVKPGEYTVSFSYYSNSNSNYNSFSVSTNFTILKSNPTHQISEQFTAFKDINFFIYQPDFTEQNTEPLIALNDDYLSSSQSNGVWNFVGYCLATGWSNTGTWECDFDVEGDIRYVDFHILCALSPSNKVTYLIGGWEGPIATNPPGTYTRDNDSVLHLLPKKLGWNEETETITTTSTFQQCHINIKKTSPTTLIVTKTNGEYNNGSVVYEWENLSNYPKLTIGARHHGIRMGTIKIQNLVVRGVY